MTTCCPKYSTLMVAVSIVLAAGAVRAWDVGVVTPFQIHFLSQKVAENTVENKLKEMGAIAYNPITKDIYVSDSNQKEGSIFRIKTTGDAAYSIVEPIVAKQNETVQGLAFDYHTSKLYWTDGSGHSIGFVLVPQNTVKVPLAGRVLHSFVNETPQGLAIDVCRGYLYWTNSNHKNATIERSFLNGTGREVLLQHKTLYQPLAIAVDVESNLLYWSNEREGMYYSIESMDLNFGTRRKLISGTHHQPFAMALDEQNIYWSDWTNRAVWTMPKDSFEGGVQPTLLAKYEFGPLGLMTPSGNTTMVNNTYCTMHREKDMAEAAADVFPDLIPYEVLKNICKNQGVLHVNGTCTCAPGFAGEFCQDSVCQGYCKSGACTFTGSGEPTCQCPENTTGVRCEVPLCSLQCENNGKCTLDSSGFSTCKCPDGYSGDVCQLTLVNELCKSHCMDVTVPESQKFDICRCEKSTNTGDYSSVRAAMSNHSDRSQCKLSKSMFAVISILTVLVASLGVITMILARKVRFLGRRPRIKKRIVVNKSITPLTYSRQQPSEQNQQCEITIENCCNMNICETPCFEPDYRPTPSSKLATMIPSLSRSKKEDKANLLSNTDMSSEDEKPVV